MGYIDKNLLQGERVVYRARLHGIIFSAPVLLAVVGVGLVVAGVAVPGFVAVAAFGIFFLAVAALLALVRLVHVKTSEFAVTNKRVLVKVGLVHRHTLELLLTKVETIGVEQSVWGRLFNFGTIVVTGTGGTKEPFAGISRPLEFRKQVQSQTGG